jgi:hypothetical protein
MFWLRMWIGCWICLMGVAAGCDQSPAQPPTLVQNLPLEFSGTPPSEAVPPKESEPPEEEPIDPGQGYVAYDFGHRVVDDGAIYGAIYHRHLELIAASTPWSSVDVRNTPLALEASTTFRQVDGPRPQLDSQTSASEADASFDELIRATLIVAAGEGDDFFTAGAVVLTPDGLAITNYHVAEYLGDRMTAMTCDGKSHRVVELLAGNAVLDTALIRLEGSGFNAVALAKEAPLPGDEIVVVHHPENRFYTYDRGYVMRYSSIGGTPTLEISASYTPGASGCGIFNSRGELVGLASSIAVGDGPYLSEGFELFAGETDLEDDSTNNTEESDESDFEADLLTMDALVVKHAIPLSAIRKLWKEPRTATARKNLALARDAFRDLKSSLLEKQWANAAQLMTTRGLDAFCLDAVDALRASLSGFPPNPACLALVRRLKLQEAIDATELNAPPRVKDHRVLAALDDQGGRWSLTTSVCAAAPQVLLEEWSPLCGEITAEETEGPAVIFAVRSNDSSNDASLPPVFIRFVRQGDSWKYDGFDWQRTDAARIAMEP